MSHYRRMLVALFAAATLLAWSALGCQSSPEQTDDRAEPPVAEEQPTQDETEGADRHDHVEQRAEQPGPDDEQLEEIAEQISDEDLEKFAEGVGAVMERERQLEQEGRDLETLEQEAESPVEIREAEEQVRQEMQDALADVGLRFPDFLQMGQLVRQSPELKERLGEFLDEDEMAEFFGE